MADKNVDPSEVEILASLVTGTGDYAHIMASVQRSHRFPVHLFEQIKNMARMGGVPVSMIINQLIASGLEALKQKLPEHVAREISLRTKRHRGPIVTDRVEVKRRKVGGKPKLERGK
jgi:hypothetical protein